MKRSLLPLLILIVGLPQLSETIYTPSLPDIAHALSVSDAWVEYTFTIYLAGYAVGILLWGRLSDRLARKPCVLAGLFIYILGCVGCYFSESIQLLMFSRFIQAFGGGAGSVLGHAICKDAFHGAERGKVYATIGSVLAFSPALGPIIGGIIDQTFEWSAVFLFLIGMGLIVFIATYFKLPETHLHASAPVVPMHNILIRLIKDPRVIAYGIIIAACNGILFSFYAEGSFYMIEVLGLNPSTYGASFIGIASAGALGGWLTRKMHDHMTSIAILKRGIHILMVGSIIFLLMTFILSLLNDTPKIASLILTLGCVMIMMTGIAMIIPSSLSPSLENYKKAIGTASSLFGFFYYMIASLFTLGMGFIHNGTLFPMPIYFFGIGVLIWIVFSKWIDNEHK
ncbi:MAG TPA: multidrug effflux MFS transporter [Gammaproteobacteria bacterium]|nr:multidrug effflux MFS transporter [Gammaproteobacteria bacterium]